MCKQTYLDTAFNKLDEDGDGFISLDELLARLPPPPPRPGPDGRPVPPTAALEAERRAEAKRMLREADTNGDGRIRCVHCKELLYVKLIYQTDSLQCIDAYCMVCYIHGDVGWPALFGACVCNARMHSYFMLEGFCLACAGCLEALMFIHPILVAVWRRAV